MLEEVWRLSPVQLPTPCSQVVALYFAIHAGTAEPLHCTRSSPAKAVGGALVNTTASGGPPCLSGIGGAQDGTVGISCKWVEHAIFILLFHLLEGRG